MYSFYEKVLSLPIFRGVTPEQITQFVEKTHLSFQTFSDAERVISSGLQCRTVKCLMSGSLRIKYPLFEGALTVIHTVEAPACIGIDRLFGLDTRYPFSAQANDSAGMMEFPKAIYMNMLHTNQILMMNYLNYLAYFAQLGPMSLRDVSKMSVKEIIGMILQLTTRRNSSNIELKIHGSSLYQLFGDGSERVKPELDALIEQGLMVQIKENLYSISNREYFIRDFMHIPLEDGDANYKTDN